ncbi:Kelch repeat-containing protein (plasmid) [Rhizobium gallicum]|uniref:Kelch repeat-containing protein n=1 Tax=Rhizobium gallicum TaxID=56730 RepID=A0A1L5NTX5_9HYPH|nr:kelch repeat-containing protein [Rhizobium gallicum]APO71355.1 Kelch repeat-containing protein [Rhizobium gallicum]
MKASWILASLIAVALSFSSAHAEDCAWRMAKPMPVAQSENSSAVIGDKWYIIGGINVPLTAPVGSVVVYDAKADSWSQVKDMPEPAHHTATVALDGKVYVFGGFVGTGGARQWQPIADAFSYDPKTDTWTKLAPMPTARGSAEAVALDGKIYVIGGAHTHDHDREMKEPLWAGVPNIVGTTVEEYDPATNTWRERAPMQTERNHFLAAAVNGEIYAIDGRIGLPFVTKSDVTDLVEAYNPKTDSWTFKSRSPTRRGGVSGAAYNGKIYVTGGEYQDPEGKRTFWAFESYDPATDTWQTLPHMQIARHGFVAGFIGNEFHVAGGSFQSDGMPGINAQMDTHEVFAVTK